MLLVKSVNSSQELVELLEGSIIAQGRLGTNLGGGSTFSDVTVDAFVDVLAGDLLFISGISGSIIIDTVTNVNTLDLGAETITPAHTSDATWRIKRGGIGANSLVWPPIRDARVEGKWHCFFDVDTFVVSLP